MVYQTTIATDVAYTGVGLHSGQPVTMRLRPSEADTGICFKRLDLPNKPTVHALAENVTATLRATTLEKEAAKVFTVEHLLSAIHAYGIDNCVIEMTAEEPPVVDGSSLMFLQMLMRAGKKELDRQRKVRRVDKVYRIDDGERFIMALPYNGFRVSFTSVNPHPLIGIQYFDFDLSKDSYEKEIAPARTIAFEGEIAALKKMGLGLGGTMENVIVYNDNGWMNSLHFKNELVRHKILDVIGDLRLAGFIEGHIVAVASGHSLNTALAGLLEKECPLY